MKYLIGLIFIMTLYGCKNQTKNFNSQNTVINESKDSLQPLKLYDSISKDSERKPEPENEKTEIQIKNINGINAISKHRLAFILDSIPKLQLLIGSGEAFFYEFPRTYEAMYGYEENYTKDSIASTMAEKARITFRDNIKQLKINKYFNELNIILDSTLIESVNPIKLTFKAIIEKEDNYTYLLYEFNFGLVLLTINENGKLIDKLISRGYIFPPGYDPSIYTDDLNYIDNNGIFHLKRYVIYAKTESTTDYLFYKAYRPDEDGKIVRYFNEQNASFEKTYTAYHNYGNIIYLEHESGTIVNHLKSGIWNEISMDYDTDNFLDYKLKTPLYSSGNYYKGLKVGTWNFYEINLDSMDNKENLKQLFKSQVHDKKFLFSKEF